MVTVAKRVSCRVCGTFFDNPTGRGWDQPPTCAACRKDIVEMFEGYDTCCKAAYCRGRISAAADQNDKIALMMLGQLLDRLRCEA